MSQRALNADIMYYMFDAANMSRWNDHLRTLDLSELDKQAHKAVIAWVIGKAEEDAGRPVEWRTVIEHTLFSFLQRIALTDLKPQVFHKIAKEKKDEVNAYVLGFFDTNIPNTSPAFRKLFEDYLVSEKDSHEDAIIRAAHYLATKWEFDTIYDVNRSVYGIEETKREIDDQISAHGDLAGVKDIWTNGSDLSKFVNILGQLRFQQRWSRTPRIPKTTVLGHSLLVANMVYLNDVDHGVFGRRVYFDYYSALFHDLPEVLTKDVITPVKTSVSGLPSLLEDIEKEMVREKIMPLIPKSWADELAFFAYDPFTDSDKPPRFGRQIKACDIMGAWMEAHVSIVYGISSRTLIGGRDGAVQRFRDDDVLEKSIGALELIGDFTHKSI